MNVLLVALGGAIGAAARYLAGVLIKGRLDTDFPWDTFLVNISGSFLIGVAFALSKEGSLSSGYWMFLAVGALGGYTTYSTFALETLQLLADGKAGAALLNTFGQLIAGLIAGYVGVLLIRGLQGMGGTV